MPEPSAKLMVLLAPAPTIAVDRAPGNVQHIGVGGELDVTGNKSASLRDGHRARREADVDRSAAGANDGAGIDDRAASRKRHAVANADSDIARDRAGIADVAGKGRNTSDGYSVG